MAYFVLVSLSVGLLLALLREIRVSRRNQKTHELVAAKLSTDLAASLYTADKNRAALDKSQAEFNSNIEKMTEIKLAAWKVKEEKRIREDAVKRSQEVLKGKVTEHIIPYFDDFEFDPRDCRFLGSPIDFVVFDGLSKDDVKRIVFLEVKTGASATLTTRERAVRDAVKALKVEWRTIHKKNSGV
jgi:predicted Holliday junction resolvase-like endonuclease